MAVPFVEIDKLTSVVQAYNGRWWKTIAGFNVDTIAINYAKNCKRNGGAPNYRVCSLMPSGIWRQVW